ncbi:hypothetical protein [Reyranella sp.]|uniref:hypothetical protein n=1 Tax=Reyranella sp. TaxID=1929291 RepID=UPI0012159612|nr:hypothetical protein [Reyranella sp.]TAJ84015.1 MAG: hypothetical protein EPO50_20810 [Reyranella sp.]
MIFPIVRVVGPNTIGASLQGDCKGAAGRASVRPAHHLPLSKVRTVNRLLVPLRFLISPIFIAAINLLILFPMVLSIIDVAKSVFRHVDTHEPVTITSTVALIMIGWGVALEERDVIRKFFGVSGRPDEARQAHIDKVCHDFGVAQLVLGLFAEIAVAMISLPDRIINTASYEYPLLAISLTLIAIAAVFQVRHIFVLLLGMWRPVPAAS